MTNTKPTSNCCDSEFKVYSSDEGTSFHVCRKCDKACDVAPSKPIWEDEFDYQFTTVSPAGINKGFVVINSLFPEEIKAFIQKVEQEAYERGYREGYIDGENNEHPLIEIKREPYKGSFIHEKWADEIEELH